MTNVEQFQNFLMTTGTDLVVKVLAALAFWIVGRWLIGKVVQVSPPQIQGVIDWLGVDRHIGNMARGVIDLRDVLYFGTIIGTCLLVTQASLESRRWR